MISELNYTAIQNVHQVLIRAEKKWGNKTALIFDETEEQFSFIDVKNHVEHIANILSHLEINRDDKVAIMLENVPEFPFTWLATSLIGAVSVPLNYRYQSFDANYIIHHSESKVIVTTAEKVNMLDQIRHNQSSKFKIITTDTPHEKADGFLKSLQQEIEPTYPFQPDVYSETLMNIQYTSGTTGKPKGCMLSQYYWINIAEKIANPSLIGINENDISLTSQPFYYMDPQWNTMATLLNGLTLVVLDHFSPSVFWKKIQQYNVTFFYVLGNMPVLLLKMPISPDEKNHQVRFIGCSAIPSQIHEQIEKRWGVPWHEVFGMTESGYDISMRREEREQYVGTNAIGRGAIDREVRIMNEDGEFLQRGKTGELVFRGKGMMDGYFKNAEATNDVFKNGWFHTGDLAYMNEDGVIFYEGRMKDMIRRSGENIAAAEVEEVIMLHETVEIAACIPVEDEIRGEEIKAYIVLKGTNEDHTILIQKFIQHCEDHLAYFKVPRYWEIRQNLPTTPSERIAKHRLLEEQHRYYDRVNETWN